MPGICSDSLSSQQHIRNRFAASSTIPAGTSSTTLGKSFWLTDQVSFSTANCFKVSAPIMNAKHENSIDNLENVSVVEYSDYLVLEARNGKALSEKP
jgi:hypothetical protein